MGKSERSNDDLSSIDGISGLLESLPADGDDFQMEEIAEDDDGGITYSQELEGYLAKESGGDELQPYYVMLSPKDVNGVKLWLSECFPKEEKKSPDNWDAARKRQLEKSPYEFFLTNLLIVEAKKYLPDWHEATVRLLSRAGDDGLQPSYAQHFSSVLTDIEVLMHTFTDHVVRLDAKELTEVQDKLMKKFHLTVKKAEKGVTMMRVGQEGFNDFALWLTVSVTNEMIDRGTSLWETLSQELPKSKDALQKCLRPVVAWLKGLDVKEANEFYTSLGQRFQKLTTVMSKSCSVAKTIFDVMDKMGGATNMVKDILHDELIIILSV